MNSPSRRSILVPLFIAAPVAALTLSTGGEDDSAKPTVAESGVTLISGSSGSQPQDSATLITTLKRSANYKTLVQLLDLAGLTPTLQGSAQFTVFAPTDAAFAELPKGKLDELKSDTATLKKLLLYHIISSPIPANQVLKLKTARTLQGPRVEFSMKSGQMQINDAAIVQPDIKASNGIVHGISKVLTLK